MKTGEDRGKYAQYLLKSSSKKGRNDITTPSRPSNQPYRQEWEYEEEKRKKVLNKPDLKKKMTRGYISHKPIKIPARSSVNLILLLSWRLIFAHPRLRRLLPRPSTTRVHC